MQSILNSAHSCESPDSQEARLQRMRGSLAAETSEEQEVRLRDRFAAETSQGQNSTCPLTLHSPSYPNTSLVL